jgi:hypothetical protein
MYILEISYNWNHIKCAVGDWLLSVGMVFSRFVYVVIIHQMDIP